MKFCPDPQAYSPKRLFCLDVLRGMDMFLLAIFGPFLKWHCFEVKGWAPVKGGFWDLFWRHADTAFAPTATGFGIWDFGQPLFLFICGAAVPIALKRRLSEDGRPTAAYWKHIGSRILLLAVLSGLNRDLLKFDYTLFMPQCDTLLVIAAGYLGAALALLIRSSAVRFALPLVLLAVYGAIQQFCGDFTIHGNANYLFDMKVFGAIGSKADFYEFAKVYPFALTSLAFAAMAMFGSLATEVLLSSCDAWKKVRVLCGFGVASFLLGLVLERAFGIPAIRQIYTLSFVFMTAGLSLLLFAVLYAVTDIWKFRRGTGWLLLYGSCSLVTWELSVFFIKPVLVIGERLAGGMPFLLGTDRYQPAIVGFWYAVVITVLLVIWYNAKLNASAEKGGR